MRKAGFLISAYDKKVRRYNKIGKENIESRHYFVLRSGISPYFKALHVEWRNLTPNFILPKTASLLQSDTE